MWVLKRNGKDSVVSAKLYAAYWVDGEEGV